MALVEAYQQLPNRCENAPTVRRAIDIVVEARLHSGAGFQATEIQQIVQSIEALKSWFADGSLDRWTKDTLAALGAMK